MFSHTYESQVKRKLSGGQFGWIIQIFSSTLRTSILLRKLFMKSVCEEMTALSITNLGRESLRSLLNNHWNVHLLGAEGLCFRAKQQGPASHLKHFYLVFGLAKSLTVVDHSKPKNSTVLPLLCTVARQGNRIII